MNASGLDTILNALRGDSSPISGEKASPRGENAEFLAAFDAASRAASAKESRSVASPTSSASSASASEARTSARNDSALAATPTARVSDPVSRPAEREPSDQQSALDRTGSNEAVDPVVRGNPLPSDGSDLPEVGDARGSFVAVDAAKAPGTPAVVLAENGFANSGANGRSNEASSVARAVHEVVSARSSNQPGLQLGTQDSRATGNPSAALNGGDSAVSPEAQAANNRAFSEAVRQAATGSHSAGSPVTNDTQDGDISDEALRAVPRNPTTSGALTADQSASQAIRRPVASAEVVSETRAEKPELGRGWVRPSGSQEALETSQQASQGTRQPVTGRGQPDGLVTSGLTSDTADSPATPVDVRSAVSRGVDLPERPVTGSQSQYSGLAAQMATDTATRQAGPVQPNSEALIAPEGTEMRTLRARAESHVDSQVRADSGLLKPDPDSSDNRFHNSASALRGSARVLPEDKLSRPSVAGAVMAPAGHTDGATTLNTNSVSPEQRFARFANALRANEPASPPPAQVATQTAQTTDTLAKPADSSLQGARSAAGSPLGETIREVARNGTAAESAQRPALVRADGTSLDDQLADSGTLDDLALTAKITREGAQTPDNAGFQRGFEAAVSQSLAQSAQPAATSTRAAESTSQLMNNQPDLSNTPDSPEFPQEILGRVRLLQNQGSHEARLNLHPAELGRMQISITTEGDATRVAFTVDNPQAREALEQAMPRLREMLGQAGLQLADSTVAQQGQQGQQGANGFDGNRSGEHGSASGSEGSAESAGADDSAPVKTLDPDRAIDAYV